MSFLDDNAQPAPSFNRWHRTERNIDELIGLSRGLLADGQLTGPEIQMLIDWLEANPDSCEIFPGNVLARRLERITADCVITPEEVEELAQTLVELVGGRLTPGGSQACTLPLNNPQPPVEFVGMTFCLTGHFAFGPRRICEKAVKDLGGECKSGVSKKVEYVVVGAVGSRDWKHSTHGTKIQKAVDLRDTGYPIAIISEDHWAEAIP